MIHAEYIKDGAVVDSTKTLKWRGGGTSPFVTTNYSYSHDSEGNYSDNKEEAKAQFFAMLDEWAEARGIVLK